MKNGVDQASNSSRQLKAKEPTKAVLYLVIITRHLAYHTQCSMKYLVPCFASLSSVLHISVRIHGTGRVSHLTNLYHALNYEGCISRQIVHP